MAVKCSTGSGASASGVQVVIPRELLETTRLREGDFVAFTQQRGGVLIKPKRLVDADDTLTPEEAKKVRKGLKQIRPENYAVAASEA